MTPDVATPTLRRMSHSAFQDFVECGEKFRLKRVVQVPQRPNLAAIAGKTFHTLTELYDLGGHMPDWAEWFELALATEEHETQRPRSEFRAFGQKTKEKPLGENIEYWRDILGPDLCKRYKGWRDNTDLTIARELPPDGHSPGIEYEVTAYIGAVRVKSIVDRIEYDANGNLGVVDIKTWRRKRASAQLPSYIVVLRKMGIPVTWGAYYEARKGTLTEPVFYTSWDEARLARLYEQAAVADSMGIYIPRPSDDCSFCSVRDHCEFRAV